MIDPIANYLHRSPGHQRPVILMYHSLTSGKGTPNWRWAVSRQRFCDQLNFLIDQGWSSTTIAELVATPNKLNDRRVVLTFDDGYVDNLEAAEELQKRGMCATWYIVTGSIGRTPAWDLEGQPRERLLNAGELNSLTEAGMEVGSHSHSHKRLTELNDTSIHEELAVSREELINSVGFTPVSFAYPYGAWNMRCEHIVRDAGFLSASTTRSGWALKDGNPYQLRRLSVFNTDTVGSFARKLCFGTNHASWAMSANYALKALFNRLDR